MKKIVWLEDKVEDNQSFKDLAYLLGVSVEAITTSSKFVQYLNENWRSIDGVVLDAEGCVNNRNETPTVKALKQATDAIQKVENDNNIVIPFCIYTGSLNNAESENLKAFLGPKKIYFKSIAGDAKRALEDLISAIRDKNNYRIKEKYTEVLALSNEKYLGGDVYNYLYELVFSLESGSIDSKSGFLHMRKLLERLYKILNKQKLIPDDVIEERGAITKCAYFLSEYHAFNKLDYKYIIHFVHPTIGNDIVSLVQVINDACHLTGNLINKIEDYMNGDMGNRNYYYKACVLRCFEILLYFNDIVVKYPDPEINKAMYVKRW